MINKRYRVVGERKEELLHPTAGYLKQAFGDSIEEISHIIGENEKHTYHFGRELGNTTVVISKTQHVYVDIVGEDKGHMTTKSKLEKKFDIKLIGK